MSKAHLDFEPVIWERDKKRRPKKGETWKLVRRGDFYVWGEPLSWLLLDHVPFRTVLWWYVADWWDDYVRGPLRMGTWRFRVHVARMYVVTSVERAARLWRAIALCVAGLAVVIGVLWAFLR